MRRRIFLTILSVAVIAVVLFGVPLAVAVERRNASDAVLELQRIAGAAASQVPDAFATSGTPVNLPTIEPSMQLALYDTTGRRVAGSGPTTADPVVRGVADGAVHDGRVDDELVVAVPVIHDERITGALRASEAADEATDRTQRTWLAMAGLAAIVAIVAGLAGSLLARQLTRPVQRLRDAAVRLGEGDFTATAPLSGLPELDAAASALSSTGQRLGGLVERERAFSADASHQLRTPLASLRLALESELAQPRADPTVALRDALSDVDRLETTLTDLLALARDTPSDRRPVDLTALLGTVESTWRGRLAVAGRALRISIEEGTPSVLISATALSTVIDVLVENAMRHGHGTVTIEASRARGGGVALMVSDEGQLAMNADVIFQRRSRQATGHGIGLALARSLAHAEGARLQLSRSKPTTFEVIIAVPVFPSPLRASSPDRVRSMHAARSQ